VSARISAEGWNSLLELATREVFELMLGSELDAPDEAELLNPEVTAMVGLAGQLCGVLSVRCEAQAARRMTSRMLSVGEEQSGTQVADALGEICNMIAGNFKNKISGLSEGCLLSPPTVISGKDYNLHSAAEEPGMQVRLRFEGMPLAIALQIHS
jgi:chemotaxis protein CheX